jgi:hypothetical protein
LGFGGYRSTATVLLQGGDTLLIDDVDHSNGSRAQYMEGQDMPNIAYGVCSPTNDPYDCEWAGIPPGPDAAHPTIIAGKQYTNGCAQKPLLWGEGLYVVMGLNGSNIQLSCLDLLGVDISSPAVRSDFGIFNDLPGLTTNISINYVDVHGFDNAGIMMGFGAQNGTIGTINLDHTRIYGNAMTGYNTNVAAVSTITITNSVCEWSGCFENYPTANSNIDDPANYFWCFTQGQLGPPNTPYAGQGGYGDGIAFGPTGNQPSGSWFLQNDYIRWNTQDGFDTIHGNGTGVTYVLNSWFEGNAGAAIKINSPTAYIENNSIIANCEFFDGQPFSGTVSAPSQGPEYCRAGTAVGLPTTENENMYIYDNTVFSNQSIMFTYGYYDNVTYCDSTTQFHLRNNLLYGGTNGTSDIQGLGDWHLTDPYYEQQCDNAIMDEDYNLGVNLKYPAKLAGTHDVYADPKIAGSFLTGPLVEPNTGPSMNPALYYQGTNGGAQFYLQAMSPAIGAGLPIAGLTTDINFYRRPNPPTIGAYEYGSVPTTPPPPPTSPPTTPPTTVATANQANVRVYPNPWRKDKHAGHPITFDQMASGSDVKIFTVSGHKVKELDGSSGTATWDLTNDSGDQVASGIYIYLIKDGQGNKIHGKVAVIQ